MFSKRSLRRGILVFLLFMNIIAITHLLAFASLPDLAFTKIYATIGLAGSLLVIGRLYRLGAVFLSGAATGLIVEGIISAINRQTPSMTGAYYNILIIFIGLAAAAAWEIAHRIKNKRQR